MKKLLEKAFVQMHKKIADIESILYLRKNHFTWSLVIFENGKVIEKD